jgi:hypothetical protein
MTVAQEFESPKSKLARARHHISGLESEIQKLIAGIRFERIIEPITPSHGSLYDRWLRKYAHDCAMEGRAPQEPPDATAYVHKIHFQSLDIVEQASKYQFGHQSQDRQGARPRNFAFAARPRRRGHRMKRREFITL